MWLQLHSKYKDKLLFDTGELGTYKVMKIQWDDKGVKKGKGGYWEATCVEVEQLPGKSCVVPRTHYLTSKDGAAEMIDPDKEEGYGVACCRTDAPVASKNK